MKGWCCPPRIVKALTKAASNRAASLPSTARRTSQTKSGSNHAPIAQ